MHIYPKIQFTFISLSNFKKINNMKIAFFTMFFSLLVPIVMFAQTVTGPGGAFTPAGLTSGVVSFTATDAVVAGSTITGITCPLGNDIADINVPAILGYNTEITNITLLGAQHTFAADLDLRLIAPNGTVITFSTDNGGSTGLDGGSDMCFDVTSTNCADTWTSSTSASQPENCLLFETVENTCGPLTAPFTFVCGANTATIEGTAVDGTWTLEITDDAGGDTGSFVSFSITFGPMTPPAVDAAGLAIDLTTCCAAPPITVIDPCNCVNGVDNDMDGSNELAAETITIMGGTPPYIITGVTGLFDAAGAPLADADVQALLAGNVISGVFVMADGVSQYTATINGEAIVGTACDVCPETTDIPTLSEWGLMTLALLLMAFGSVKMAVGSLAFSGAGSQNLPLPGNTSFRLPFVSAIFRKAMLFTCALAGIGFAICFALYGAIFMTDIVGFAIAGPIFAYLIHLLYVLETHRD